MTALALVVVLAAVRFGPADTIARVRFEGNRAFGGRALSGSVNARKGSMLDERQLDADARVLAAIYRDNGFRSVEVNWETRPARRHWQVVFLVEEGVRSRVGGVRFEGNIAWDSTRLAGLVTAVPGRQVSAAMAAEGEERLVEFYSNNGYPFVQVNGEWEHQDTLSVLEYAIDEGPRCHVSALRVRGNRRVSTRVVLRAVEMQPGELFSRKRLQEAQRRLYATRLFQRVLFYVLRPDGSEERLPGSLLADSALAREPGAEPPQPESVIIRYDVTEQLQRGVAFGAGFEAPPFRLLGSVDWQHLNVFGRAHVIETGVEYSPDFSGDYRLGLRMNYRVPYVFGARVDFTFAPFFKIERADTALSLEYGSETGISRYLTPQLSVGLFNRLRLVADTGSAVTNALALNLQFDTRDDVLDPGRGVHIRPVAEVAGGLLQGSNDFYRITGELRWFGQLLGAGRSDRGLVLATRLAAGSSFPYGRTGRIPYYEGFTLGGRNNLRGYWDRSLGPDSTGPRAERGFRYGPMLLNANLELRSPYFFNLVGLVAFADGGEVAGPEVGFSLGAFEYSAGVGVRVRTPIGPVRADWGRQLKDPPAGDRGRLYFGLLHAF